MPDGLELEDNLVMKIVNVFAEDWRDCKATKVSALYIPNRVDPQHPPWSPEVISQVILEH